jgi:hypothetical protein
MNKPAQKKNKTLLVICLKKEGKLTPKNGEKHILVLEILLSLDDLLLILNDCPKIDITSSII